ncbi:MAG: hypothetical protein ISS51_02090 [Dehalococcoidales bacterium]|nr:hypothetical protein [Dehalococcoidales bacterium]
MKAKLEIVKIIGKKFLRCQEEDCRWNIGWLGGYDWTEEPGKGVRVCNLGARAMIEDDAAPPQNCSQPSAVFELAHTEFES